MSTKAIREALEDLRLSLEDHPNTRTEHWERYVRARDEVDAIEAGTKVGMASSVAREAHTASGAVFTGVPQQGGVIGVGPLGHLKPPLGRSPFCAYDKCDNPPTTPGRYCCVHDDPNRARGTALDPTLAHQQTPSMNQCANVPSGKAMLLDGPAPAPAQVAHLRNAVLEEAAQDIESLNNCLRDAHSVAKVLRNLKGAGK